MMNGTTEPVADDPTRPELDHLCPHPPARVWRALTEPELMGRRLMAPDSFEPRVGRRFTFRGQPMPSVGFSGTVSCVVLAATRPVRLSQRWNRSSAGAPRWTDS